jgi:hypothetical protein
MRPNSASRAGRLRRVVVAPLALVLLFLAFVVVKVRSAKTNMSVRIGRIFEIQRGKAEPPTAPVKPDEVDLPVGGEPTGALSR